MRDEALFCCSVLREISPSLLSLERVLDTLDASQEVPQHTRLHLRGTPRVPPRLNKSPFFPSSSRDEGPLPCFVRKGILAFPLCLKRRQSHLESREELQGSCHHSKRPDVPNHSRYTCFPCTDSTVTTTIDSQHDCTCDSLPGASLKNPAHGKTHEEGIRTYTKA